jgi:transposase
MRKKYHVQLSTNERQHLETIIRSGNAPARTQTHARILLKADAADGGPAWTDDAIASACDVSRPTIERVRRAFATAGLQAALHRRRPQRPSRPRKLDGAQEAHLIALTCSPPPEGQERWTLALLADRLVELDVVDSIARDTIRLTLKKTNSNRG